MAGHHKNRNSFSRAQFLSSILSNSAVMTMGLFAFSATALADSANPWADISAVSGSISKDLSVANVNTITQHSDRTVTTASSADILSNQTVNILQNNSGSLFVLKTTGADQDGAQIQGALNANGRVMVLDRNGVFFGSNARIDVGGIVASTGDVDNDAVMRGDTTLTLKDFGDASVVNNGLISVNGSGLAALVAPHVVNNGVIQAKMGKVVLASGGESATVDLYGDGLVELAVGGKTGKALAENAGVIEGSTVLMTASGAKEIVDTVINMTGVIHATSATVQGGKIILGGGNTGKVKVAGKMDASGATGGGAIVVAGENVTIETTANLKADALVDGQGGDIRMLGEESALFRGHATARGGALGGNGGFIELSAGESFLMAGGVDTTAVHGATGTFLLDPRDLEFILGTRNWDLSLNRIYESDVETLSWFTNIDLLARRNFTVRDTSEGYSDGVININNGNDLTIRTTNTEYVELKWVGGIFGGLQWVVTEANNAGRIDLTGNTQYGKNLEWKTSGTGNINILGATAGDHSSDIVLSKLTTDGGDITVDTKNGTITWEGDVSTNGGHVTGTATGENKINATINTDGGTIFLAGGGDTAWGHTSGLYVTVNGNIMSNGGDITLVSDNAKAIINGQVAAGSGDLDVLANNGGRIEFWGAGSLQGHGVNLESSLGISQGVAGKITANTLTGKSGQQTSLEGQNNLIALGNFETGNASHMGGFILNEGNGFVVSGIVSTTGGDIQITTNGTAFGQALDIQGQLDSANGDIALDSKSGGMFVSGKIDAGNGDIDIKSRHLQLRNGTVIGDDLTINAGLISQAAGGKVIANTLGGTSGSTAILNGVGNKIKTVTGFMTGLQQGVGAFLLKNDQALRIDGAITTKGGDITVVNNEGINLRVSGSLDSKGGDIALKNTKNQMYIHGHINAGAGDIALDSVSNIELNGNSSVIGNALDLKSGNVVKQTVTSKIETGLLTGMVDKTASLLGAENNIATLGGFATGLSAFDIGGFSLHEKDGFSVNGAVTTDGGDITIKTDSNSYFDLVTLESSGSFVSKGGDIDVDLNGAAGGAFIAKGLIDAGTGDVRLNSRQLKLQNGSVVLANDLNTTGGLVNQSVGSKIVVAGLRGSLTSYADFSGAENDIGTLYDFITGKGSGAGGFILNDSANGLNIDGRVETDGPGSNIDIRTIGNLTLENGAVIEAKGGNIALNQTGIFFADADSVRTRGAGTIDLMQNDGGRIQNPIDSINNTGTGLNTVTVGHGSYNESVKVDKAVTLLGANAGIAGDGVRGAESVVTPNSPGFHVTADGAVIDGFLITGASGADGYGVWVDGADNADIKNNIIDNSAQSGIQFTNALNGLATANKITDSGDSGIRLDGSHNAMINNNDISGSDVDGIRAFDSNFLTANNNDIYNVGGSGIGIQNNNNASFDGNKITSVSRGFWIGSSNDVAILNSEIINAGTGIRILDASNGVQVKGNQITGGFNAILVLGNSSDIDIGGVGAGEANTITGTGGTAVATTDSNFIRIVNNIINGAADDGISITRGGNLTIQLNEVDSINDHAILTDNVANLTIEQNKIGQGAGIIGNNGIHVVGSSGTQIHGNIVSATNTGIYALNTADLSIGSTLGNTVTGGKNGIRVENVSGNLLIQNNNTSGANDTHAGRIAAYLTGIGILVADSTGTVNVTDNNASGNIDGIRILRTHNANIANNTTNGNSDKGIIINRSNNASVVDNISNGNDTGIWVELSNDVTLTDNLIQNSQLDGIHLRNSLRTLVSGNDVLDNVKNGIWVETSNGSVIDDNDLSGSSTAIGVKVTNSSTVQVTDNDITDFETGVSILNGNNNQVVGNDVDEVLHGIASVNSNNLTVRSNELTGKAGSTGTAIDINGGNNIIVGGLLFSEGNIISGFRDGIIGDSINGLTVEGNIVSGGTGGTAIGAYNSTNVAIGNDVPVLGIFRANIVDGFGYGIHADSSDAAKISQNLILNSQTGIRVSNSDSASVYQNAVLSSGWDGIQIVDGSLNARVENNIIDGAGASGIAVMNGADGAQLLNNQIDNVDRLGIYVWNSDDLRIRGNDIANTGMAGGASWYLSGIHLEGSSNTVVADNDITGTGGDGIHIGGAGNQAAQDTSGNIIRNNRISDTVGDGIEVIHSDDAVIRANNIQDADGQGIFVDNSDYVGVNGNIINNVKLDGIKLEAGDDIIVGGNNIDGAGRVGIYSSKTTNLTIRNNTLNDTTFDIGAPYGAITTEQGANIAITGNTTTNSGHGIQMMWVDGVNDIRNNTIDSTVNNGIHADDIENLTIAGNDIGQNAGAANIKGHGVHVAQSSGALIRNNDVSNTVQRGINIHHGGLIEIRNNTLDQIGQEGVRTEQVHGLDIVNNGLTNIGWNGMDIQGGSNVTLHNNRLNMVGGKGIHVAGAQISTIITRNDISEINEDGILVNGTPNSVIRNNLIHTIGKKNNADYNAIAAKNVNNGLRIVNNHIGYTDRIGTEGGADNIKHIGILVADSDRAVIRDNMLTMSRDGIVLDGNNRVRVLSNVINNAGANGLYAVGQTNGQIILADNTFNNNVIGAQFESGEIDLTGAANIFTDGMVGMRFDPTAAGDPLKLELVGNTLGTTEFTGQTQYYAELANGAFFAPGMPTVLNALDASYDGFSPSSVGGILTQPQYDALESKFFHYNDDPSLGLFFFGLVPFNLDDSDVYNSFGAQDWANGRFRMTILSLPNVPGAQTAGAGGQAAFGGNIANFLANIAPAAGGDNNEQQQVQGEDMAGILSSIEPAAGAQESTCWSDAISRASTGAAVSYSFGGTDEETLNQAAACGSTL